MHSIILLSTILLMPVFGYLATKFFNYAVRIGAKENSAGKLAGEYVKEVMGDSVKITTGSFCHYNIDTNTVKIPRSRYYGVLVSDLVIALHEVGHHMQKLKIRRVIPYSLVSTGLILMALGFIAKPEGLNLIACLGLAVIIAATDFKSLWYEFDASRRALKFMPVKDKPRGFVVLAGAFSTYCVGMIPFVVGLSVMIVYIR